MVGWEEGRSSSPGVGVGGVQKCEGGNVHSVDNTDTHFTFMQQVAAYEGLLISHQMPAAHRFFPSSKRPERLSDLPNVAQPSSCRPGARIQH